MNFLPDAIAQTLERVQFKADAPPLRELPEDEAEYEEGDMGDGLEENQPKKLPPSGTCLGTPPALDPHDLPMPLSLIQKARANTPSGQQPEPPNLPPNRWQGWKTQTGPTIADMEQSRRSPHTEHQSEMPDAELKEAMARSTIQDIILMRNPIPVEHQGQVELILNVRT